MHFERLVIESGERTFGLDLHPQLTVIAGANGFERDGLINELVGALGPGRSGVHAELRADDGSRYAVFRPAGGEHRVVDIDQATDVSHRFRNRDGQVSIIGRAGIGPADARHLLRMTATDLAASSRGEEMVMALAQVDQGRLWDLARKVRDCEAELRDLEACTGNAAEDAELIEEIERRHAQRQAEEERHESTRHSSFVIAATAGILSVPLGILLGPLAMLVLATVAICATVVSIKRNQAMDAARRHEAEALEQAGVDSYLTFQIHRVNSLHGSAAQRRRLVLAAEAVRAATAEWNVLVGDIPVDWAFDNRGEVALAARRLRSSDAVRNPMAVALSAGETTAAELGEVVRNRVEVLEHAGPLGESLPLLLDDPLREIEPEAKAILLETLTRCAQRCQIIYLTNDPDVAEWARIEVLTGDLAIVEPTTTTHETDTDNPDRPRRLTA